jgi:hypothetical protein
MQFHIFLAYTATLLVAVQATPVAGLGYKEKCAIDGSLGGCMPGYYCKVHQKFAH